MSGDSKQQSAAGAMSLAGNFTTGRGDYFEHSGTPQTDAYGRKNNDPGASGNMPLYGPGEGDFQGIPVDTWMNGRGVSGGSLGSVVEDKLRQLGLNPDGSPRTDPVTVNLPTPPVLPTLTVPTVELPDYQDPGEAPVIPGLNPITEMPTIGSAATEAARRRELAAIAARRGRAGTFLTTPSGRTQATPEAPKPPMARRRTGAGVFR